MVGAGLRPAGAAAGRHLSGSGALSCLAMDGRFLQGADAAGLRAEATRRRSRVRPPSS